MNADHMFRIGKEVFKVFEAGIVTADIDSYAELLALTEKDLDNMDKSTNMMFAPSIVKSMSKAGLGWTIESTGTKDKERVTVSLNCLVVYSAVNTRYYEFQLLVRPYKKTLGIFYWCNRTITTNLYADVYIAESSRRLTDNYAGSSPQSKREVTMSSGVYLYYGTKSDIDMTYIKSTGGYARIPAVSASFVH